MLRLEEFGIVDAAWMDAVAKGIVWTLPGVVWIRSIAICGAQRPGKQFEAFRAFCLR